MTIRTTPIYRIASVICFRTSWFHRCVYSSLNSRKMFLEESRWARSWWHAEKTVRWKSLNFRTGASVLSTLSWVSATDSKLKLRIVIHREIEDNDQHPGAAIFFTSIKIALKKIWSYTLGHIENALSRALWFKYLSLSEHFTQNMGFPFWAVRLFFIISLNEKRQFQYISRAIKITIFETWTNSFNSSWK